MSEAAASSKTAAAPAPARVVTRAPEHPAQSTGTGAAHGPALRLQQSAGNRAMGALLAEEREADTIAARVTSTNSLHPLQARFGPDIHAALHVVRIHHDQPARAMADALDAQAFTIGDDIFWGDAAHGDRTLLAHELVHVLQQRAGGGLRIQRKPKSEKMVQATPEDKRQFIKDTITFLTDMADFYRSKAMSTRATKKPKPFDPKKVLATWKTTVASDLTMIANDLGGDATLTANLQQAYAAAVREVLGAAAASEGITLHQAYEKYRDQIHEAGWPEGSVDDKSSDLSNAIPAAERAKIRVISTTIVPTADLNIKDEFDAKAPTDPNTSFSGTVPDKLKDGLKNVAIRLMRGLTPPVLTLNSTVSLALDLGGVGGDYALYRFTFFEHTEKGKKSNRLIIERLGPLGIDEMKPSRAKEAEKKFKAHGFKFKGVWKAAEKESVFAAIDLIADPLLSLVDGVSFDRDGIFKKDPDTAGNYDVKTHTITLFDRAFNESAVRIGPGGSRAAANATYAVAHEIGHAVDRRKMRAAMVKEEQAKATLKKNFGQFETSPGNFELNQVPNDVVAEFNKELAAAKAAGTAVENVETESGVGFSGGVEVANKKTSTPFRTAGAGTRLSPRSLVNFEEYFAESFAIFSLDPDTLKRLRPKIHDYFVKTFTPPAPKAAPKSAPKTTGAKK